MTIRPILSWPDARLRAAAEPVAEVTDAIRDLVADLIETMYAAPGRGLAATQVGAMQRVFVMDTGWKEGNPNPIAMINPTIIRMSQEHARGPEGCLSLPGLTVDVERPAEVRIRWMNLAGEWEEADLTGFAAICAQHERDHLDGILCIDRLSDAERAAVEPRLAEMGQKA